MAMLEPSAARAPRAMLLEPPPPLAIACIAADGGAVLAGGAAAGEYNGCDWLGAGDLTGRPDAIMGIAAPGAVDGCAAASGAGAAAAEACAGLLVIGGVVAAPVAAPVTLAMALAAALVAAGLLAGAVAAVVATKGSAAAAAPSPAVGFEAVTGAAAVPEETRADEGCALHLQLQLLADPPVAEHPHFATLATLPPPATASPASGASAAHSTPPTRCSNRRYCSSANASSSRVADSAEGRAGALPPHACAGVAPRATSERWRAPSSILDEYPGSPDRSPIFASYAPVVAIPSLDAGYGVWIVRGDASCACSVSRTECRSASLARSRIGERVCV